MNRLLKTQLAALLLVISCGISENPDLEVQKTTTTEQRVFGMSFVILGEAQPEVLSDGPLQGSGTLKFNQFFEDVDSAYNFRLKFELSKHGSQLTFVSHADANLQSGIEVQFKRNRDLDSKLDVMVRASGREVNWSEAFAHIDASRSIDLSLDIHNDHGPRTHFIFWDEQFNSKEIFDSAGHAIKSPGKGFGLNTGLSMKDAIVYEFDRDHPRDSHHH